MQCLRYLSRAAPSSLRPFSTTTARPLARMQIIGRLADAPEEYATSTGRSLVRYAVAVDTGPKDDMGQRPTSFFRVTSFDREGPFRDLLLGLSKGTKIWVEADAKMDKYQGPGGENRLALNLVQRSFEIVQSVQSREERGEEGETTGAESSTNRVEEPMSGLGAS